MFDLFDWSKVWVNPKLFSVTTKDGHTITVPKGFHCDGASGPALDIQSQGWWVHNWVYYHGRYDNGDRITFQQAQVILSEILRAEGRWARAITWFLACRYSGASKRAWSEHRLAEMRRINDALSGA